MERFRVILIVLNKNFLRNALTTLNYNKAMPVAVLTEDGDGKFITITDKIKVQVLAFSSLRQVLELGRNFLWLICGRGASNDAPEKMKKFLTANQVPENNIVNFEVIEQINPFWLANLRYMEENAVNCFATGNSFTERGLNFKNLPDVKGVNLAATNQDLRQSFLTAQHVFKKVKRGAIKFVFIGLTPYSLRVDNRKNFSTCAAHFAYSLALRENLSITSAHDKWLVNLLNNNVKKIFDTITSARADINFDKLKIARNKKISVADMTTWEEELANQTKNFDAAIVEDNLRILEDYIKLCIDNGAKPIGILFPFATVLRENYSRESLVPLRRELQQLEKIYNFTFIDMFDAQANYDCFSDMTHLNLKGAALASMAIDFELRGKDFLPLEKISALNYEQIFSVSNFLSKDGYNDSIEKYFKLAAKKIRQKKKIKVGFVSDDPSMWCGDYLFNLFAKNKNCETTFFLCLQKSLRGQPLSVEDFKRGLKGFKSRGINVIGVTNDEQTFPAQDVLIMLRPYFQYMPKAFALPSISAETLMFYIPYGFNTCTWNIYDTPIYHLGCKLFFDTQFHINLLEKECRVGMPRGFYSGYPKLDDFYKDPDALKFDWKMARPDAKKIIWAPHWSISSGILYSTFQWNYKFMYEFAKAHPEISWVVKPHPMLFASAVGHKVFPSNEAFKKYLQAWDALPNAKVYSGSYYQGLFATSDGMIMDCGSWIGEYQYTHKPMIFLTRETQKFNGLGNALMKILYRVDGKNLNGIAALMQKIFIEGKDEMFEIRKKFFDANLNYMKTNGMTASDFIFNTISKELKL